ncbi:MAG: hypothetical protein VR66_01090 [Peptococcaceae bacterium BRH_c23]|nr:MAG: hypothetical protein VR66_01090 [Peptococcaceae bacterium BRH_c23]KJS90369.1 MAG: hypothetical protein JL57_02240 [Desulfosporosinus sp. BICA1-9]HBW38360.1 hypothetical protein [Desulfosporosinus sp.]
MSSWSSGKLYDIREYPSFSFNSWYIQNLRSLQLMVKKDGRTNEPGIFKASGPPMKVDQSEQKLTIIIYQDEYGNQFEIPIQVPESNFDDLFRK